MSAVARFVSDRMRTRLGQVSLGMIGIGIFLICHGLYTIVSAAVFWIPKAAGWV